MNPEQALQLITNLSNLSVRNGGIFDSVNEAASVSMALNVLNNVIKENESLRELISKNDVTEDSKLEDSDEKY
jgi:hypothetical protein